MANLPSGEYDVRVQVKSPDPEVHILTVNPQKIRVRLQEKREKSGPGARKCVGRSGLRLRLADARCDAYSCDRVRIGARRGSGRVGGSGYVSAQCTGRGGTERTRCTPRNEIGDPVGFVSLSPRDVFVSIPVAQLPGYRETAILVEPNGRPASGYTISGVSADPKLIMLFGDPAIISGLSGYITVPVDISDAKADVVERVPLRLPENISALGTQSVDVQVVHPADPRLGERQASSGDPRGSSGPDLYSGDRHCQCIPVRASA